MLNSRKIIALVMAVMLLIGALSCFTFAASSVTAILPEGYMVVDKQWNEKTQNECFEYTLGGETYLLEFGVTAFVDLETASAAILPIGVERTIVLVPGEYSDMTLTSDMNLSGPYFGKNPNNNPNLPDYDPSMPDWAPKNDRSVDPTKEAVFTGTLSIDDGCDNVTIDGLAFTDGGMISDTDRSSRSIEVTYNFKNLYFDSCNVGSVINCYTGASTRLNRYIYIDQCRIENCTTDSYPIYYRAETLELTNSCMKGLYGSKNQFYMYTGSVNNCLSVDKIVRNSFINNRFEDILGNNFINFAARPSANPDITQRPRNILEVIGNEFINVCESDQVIQDQYVNTTQEVTIVGNVFYTDEPRSIAINLYVDDSVPRTHTYLDISKNYFTNYSRPIDGANSDVSFLDVGPNYYFDGDVGSGRYVTYVDGEVYDESLKYASTDFNLLNCNIGSIAYEVSDQDDSRTATLYCTDSATTTLPLFRFRGEEVTYKVYTNSACTTELKPDTFKAIAGKAIYIKAQEGDYTCTYTVTISNSGTNKSNLYAYGDAEVFSYNGNTSIFVYPELADDRIFTFPKGDDVEVSGGATYAVYADAGCLGDPITRIVITENPTLAYLKVTSSDGTNSAIYTINIFAEPVSGGGANLDASSECKLLKLRVPGATVSVENGTYIVDAKSGVKSIAPQLVVSEAATYQFYLDAACKYPAASTATVSIDSLQSKFFVRVIAEDGTRSEAIPVVVNSARKVATYTDGNDLPAYARKAVNFLNKNGYGIFAGDNNGKLNARRNITRYELAKVMVVLTGINLDMADSVNLGEIFDDFYTIQGEAAWAIPYIRAAYATGMINGVSRGNDLYFDGNGITTREQFTTVFVRSVALANDTTVDKMFKSVSKKANAAFSGKYKDEKKISSWALKAIKLATYNEYVEGSGDSFSPKVSIIRADVARIIYNSLTK